MPPAGQVPQVRRATKIASSSLVRSSISTVDATVVSVISGIFTTAGEFTELNEPADSDNFDARKGRVPTGVRDRADKA